MNEFADEPLREVTGDLDGPACKCGAIMVPENGGLKEQLYWRCLSCGETKPK